MEIGKKYYILTYYNMYFEATYIRQFELYGHIKTVMRTRLGDITLDIDISSNTYVTDNFDSIKLEIGKRLYRGISIKRLPQTHRTILMWCINRFPDKLL